MYYKLLQEKLLYLINEFELYWGNVFLIHVLYDELELVYELYY